MSARASRNPLVGSLLAPPPPLSPPSSAPKQKQDGKFGVMGDTETSSKSEPSRVAPITHNQTGDGASETSSQKRVPRTHFTSPRSGKPLPMLMVDDHPPNISLTDLSAPAPAEDAVLGALDGIGSSAMVDVDANAGVGAGASNSTSNARHADVNSGQTSAKHDSDQMPPPPATPSKRRVAVESAAEAAATASAAVALSPRRSRMSASLQSLLASPSRVARANQQLLAMQPRLRPLLQIQTNLPPSLQYSPQRLKFLPPQTPHTPESKAMAKSTMRYVARELKPMTPPNASSKECGAALLLSYLRFRQEAGLGSMPSADDHSVIQDGEATPQEIIKHINELAATLSSVVNSTKRESAAFRASPLHPSRSPSQAQSQSQSPAQSQGQVPNSPFRPVSMDAQQSQHGPVKRHRSGREVGHAEGWAAASADTSTTPPPSGRVRRGGSFYTFTTEHARETAAAEAGLNVLPLTSSMDDAVEQKQLKRAKTDGAQGPVTDVDVKQSDAPNHSGQCAGATGNAITSTDGTSCNRSGATSASSDVAAFESSSLSPTLQDNAAVHAHTLAANAGTETIERLQNSAVKRKHADSSSGEHQDHVGSKNETNVSDLETAAAEAMMTVGQHVVVGTGPRTLFPCDDDDDNDDVVDLDESSSSPDSMRTRQEEKKHGADGAAAKSSAVTSATVAASGPPLQTSREVKATSLRQSTSHAEIQDNDILMQYAADMELLRQPVVLQKSP